MYFITVLNSVSMSLFSPLINRQIEELGVSSFAMGAVGSVFGLTLFLSSLFIGRLSEEWSCRRLFIIALIATGLSNLVQATVASGAAFVTARASAGLFKHTPTLGRAVLVGLVPRKSIQDTLGRYNAFCSIGWIIGPAIGGRLSELGAGYQLACLIAGLSYAIIIGLFKKSVLNVEPLRQIDSGTGHKTKTTKVKSVSWNSVTCVVVTQFCFTFALSSLQTNLPRNLMTKFSVSVGWVGYLNSIQSLTGSLVGFVVGPVLRHAYNGKCRHALIQAGMLEAIGILCLAFSATSTYAGLSIILIEITNSFLTVATVGLALEGGDEADFVLWLNQMASVLALVTAPAASGLIQSTQLRQVGSLILGFSVAALGVLLSLPIFPNSTKTNLNSPKLKIN